MPALASVFGEPVMRMDLPMLFSGVDQETWRLDGNRRTPLQRAQDLAAQAWGASRTWFITNGASSGNHIACMAVRALGAKVIAQRSMHSSVIDGMVMAGIDPVFIAPEVDTRLGAALGVTAHQVATALEKHPDTSAVYIVSPSYFGTVADVRAIADVAHAHGVALVVDEAWGAHLGFHSDLPVNAVRAGADLVISSTHKFAGSLTQTAMLMLGTGSIAARLEPWVERAHRSFQSTSSSALLMLSLDETRRYLAIEGSQRVGKTLQAVSRLRERIRNGGRFSDPSDRLLAYPDVYALDPFKVVIDTRAGGISGAEAHHVLMRDHRIVVELSTDNAVILLVGATAEFDVDYVVNALHALPETTGYLPDRPLPPPTTAALGLREAYFSPFEIVSAERAIGRISSDSLAAYPPGIPNVLPGEVLTSEIVEFLLRTASSPAGYVRGAVEPSVQKFRVVSEPVQKGVQSR